MGMLTGTWTDTDAAKVRDLQQQQNEINAEIAGYRRKRTAKTCKPTVQLRSFKDPKQKPSRIMWIHRKKNKRKSRLAKQKYNYSGFDPDNYTYRDSKNSPWITRQTSITQFPITHQGTPSWEQDGHVRKRFTDPQVYEGAYRRKPKSKKIVWFRNKKQRKKSRLAKQKYKRSMTEGEGLREDVYDQYGLSKPEGDEIFADKYFQEGLKRKKGERSLRDSGVDVVYRRKHPKKKQKKRNRKK